MERDQDLMRRAEMFVTTGANIHEVRCALAIYRATNDPATLERARIRLEIAMRPSQKAFTKLKIMED